MERAVVNDGEGVVVASISARRRERLPLPLLAAAKGGAPALLYDATTTRFLECDVRGVAGDVVGAAVCFSGVYVEPHPTLVSSAPSLREALKLTGFVSELGLCLEVGPVSTHGPISALPWWTARVASYFDEGRLRRLRASLSLCDGNDAARGVDSIATAADALSVAVRRMCVLSAHRIAARVRLVVPSFPELDGEDERLSRGGKDGLVYCSSDLTDAETR
jgi:hypothetical protein